MRRVESLIQTLAETNETIILNRILKGGGGDSPNVP